MSKRPGKPRAASSKAFTSFGSSSLGGFSTAASGTNLSYLAEPPDFSSISDANIVVALKNLLKKDATTKAKALEELVAYAQTHPYDDNGGPEEPVLEAWVQLYPRVSIDNSRRVRELSHALQFELMKSARKRMEKRVPKIVGSWLAGTFDRDRSVSRVATEGLSSFLTTPEKVLQFWKRCQQQILDYASDAINETTDTLSDQRSTNADDAEAKYHRVLSGSLSLVLNLLQKLETTDLEKCCDSYDQFFENNKAWAGITSDDAVVRRNTCQLLCASLEKRPDRIKADLTRLSKFFIAEGLKSSQTSSTTDLVVALTHLTAKHPTAWTDDYRGKKPSVSRLKTFLEKGSQGGTSRYWTGLSQLLGMVPEGVLPRDTEGAAGLLKSMRLGVTSRDEPRHNALDAWSAYLGLARQFLESVPSAEARLEIIQENVFPLTAHYLHPGPETAPWASGSQLPILIKAFTSTATSSFHDVVEATKMEWSRLKDELKERVRTALPEASRDYQKSQKAVADEGSRWFLLVGKILDAHKKTVDTDRPIPDIPAQPSLELLQACLDLLETRNWKPFGAASTVKSAFKESPMLFERTTPETSHILNVLGDALTQGGEDFLKSPSASYVYSSINLLGDIPEQQDAYRDQWEASVTSLTEYIEIPEALPALTEMVSSESATPYAQQLPALQTILVRKCLMTAVGNPGGSWELFEAALNFDTMAQTTITRLIKELASRVTNALGQPHTGVIKSLKMIAQKKPETLIEDEETHMALMTKLLSLSEQSAELPELSQLRMLMETPTNGSTRLLGLVQQNINSVDASSLSVGTLVQQAIQVYESLDPTEQIEPDSELAALIPDSDIWRRELSILLEETPDPSLALTSSLGGAYFVPVTSATTPNTSSSRDQNGCSIPGRMALYTANLLSAGFGSRLTMSAKVDIIINLSLTADLTTDQLTVMSESKVWHSLESNETQSDAESLISSSRKAVINMIEGGNDWLHGSGSVQSRLVHEVVQRLVEDSKTPSPMGLYCARALGELLSDLTERYGFSSHGEQWLANMDILKSSTSTVLPGVAVLGGLGEAVAASRTVGHFCNRLISDVAGAKLGEEKSLIALVLLDACMQVYDVGELPVANNRLVFAVKQITTWFETPDELDYRFAAEACRCLQYLLPCIKDVYGPYWEKTIDFCIHLWTKQIIQSLDCRLPEIHASLRLMSNLEALQEPNDDLTEALQASSDKRSAALMELLKLPRVKFTQPLEIVDSMVCRQVEKLPLHHIKDLSDLYGLVASDSRPIQTASFTILSKALPAAQEQLSVDVLLEKKDARLPDELLSLLLDAPTLDAYSDDILARFPTPIRSYLLSWHLVFDAFQAASFKVRSDYAENLKAANYIGSLMEFVFDVLGHSAAHPLNLDKANFTSEHIRNYDLKLADAETEERNMQWLLIHLYYLVLKYTPGLFKSWYIECRSKQTKIAVEAWMAKYFSPIIISEALDDVMQWNESPDASTDDDKELLVKVSRAAREVIAGYEVDELQASISIRIPQEYPLEPVTVVGINRVAVNERKWQSWILTTQGVITFSGGSIIDGLITFRRNVSGALKGQSECAICYSIISSDKKMPDKRCQTCKNLFHRTCLYKWFQSSSQNTCPLCRNPIDYLGADTRARRNV
ncbi:hypothetical protein GGR56DRAFT_632310 [Xylariaceae sp. FL0804]|nr:hypothetical protein GGR56DRAFT_632310 [Xylariaceae sp. FL0804]